MKFGTFLALFFLLFSSIAMTLPDYADAARMGGGRSFGSKPFMNTPTKQPTVRQQTQTHQQPGAMAGAAARPGGMFGGMGGLFGGLLAGTLLGSLLSGNGFAGGGFMDILLIGILLFLAYKLFLRFRNQPAASPAGRGNIFNQHQDIENQQNINRQSANPVGWDALHNASNGYASPNVQNNIDVPADFNVDEFLQGAKMAYNRMQKSWDKRDLNDISQFVTPVVLKELQAQANADPNPSNTEIMLVNADLVGVENESNDQRAQVYFDVLMRESPSQTTPSSVREIWHFLRQGKNGTWKLDGIQQVD